VPLTFPLYCMCRLPDVTASSSDDDPDFQPAPTGRRSSVARTIHIMNENPAASSATKKQHGGKEAVATTTAGDGESAATGATRASSTPTPALAAPCDETKAAPVPAAVTVSVAPAVKRSGGTKHVSFRDAGRASLGGNARSGSQRSHGTPGTGGGDGDSCAVEVVGVTAQGSLTNLHLDTNSRRWKTPRAGGGAHGSDCSSSGDDESDDEGTSLTYKLAVRVRNALGRPIKIMTHTRDFNRVDADEAIAQAKLKTFHPKDDFLDMVKQYGLVLMFTVVWALAPLAAFLNNVVEVRFDAFKVLVERQRPVPREDSGIGGWLGVFTGSIQLALPVVAGLIVIATGGLEWWMFSGCHVGWPADDTSMVPDWDCFEQWAWRLLVGVLIERLGTMLVSWFGSLSAYDATTKRRIAEIDRERVQAIQDSLLPGMPDGLGDDLAFLFEKLDTNRNGVLNRDELVQLLFLVSDRPLSDMELSVLLSEADYNESNTVTVAEFAYAIQKLQKDDILTGLVRMDNLATACRRLAEGVRSGEVKLNLVCCCACVVGDAACSTAVGASTACVAGVAVH